ncbi:hypothetical protein [Ideonella paludis]|uniref:PH domain-containing protein n=1 Tax=Ideonella paludis TaxID=1233411 RepID=A0ABS5DZ79_9BURK|nr:hypothetical protein [Ideonella paludis]MBQ0936452.1 hypothetical protein [Ideonella paludis]
MRSRYETGARSAEVAGFDHSSAVFNWFGIAGGVLPWLIVPGFFAMPWQTAFLCTLVALAALSLLVLPFRYQVSVHPNNIVIERWWAGIRYKRVNVPNNQDLRFMVNGTGDWNDEGMWPGKHYCEVVSPGQSDLMIGNPSRAEELAVWLASQAHRVAAR